MKKQLICMAAAVSMMFAAVTSYAATYETSSNAVTTSDATGMKTVLIYKGVAATTPGNDSIVYVDQAVSDL
jgi:ABC-type Fe3+-hydroxamate transport system substrate-binding protein